MQVEQQAKTTLLPRFSLKWLLGFTAVAGLISLVLAQAVRGEPWAVGAVVALASLVPVFFVHAWFFAVAWLLALVRRVFSTAPRPSSPFASAGPPAQLVSPTEPQ